MTSTLDQQCVNTLRFLSIDAVQKAASGHPGLPMGAAPMAYVLWTQFLKHNPTNPDWFDRNRFVLHRYVGDAGDVIGIDRSGASAPSEVVMSEYGCTVDNVCQRARSLLRR